MPPTPALIIRRLMPRHGPVELPRRLDPLGEFVFTILSQSTADTNSRPAYEKLVDRFDNDWDRVRRARVTSIASAIRSAGLANQKAPRIKALLNRLHRQHGATTLDHIHELDDRQAVEYLTSFDGVGPKTAACVLMFACRRPVLPVDTHVHRLAIRLGLIEQRVSADAAHTVLQAKLRPHQVLDFHVLLIRHGRTICRARRPTCHDCPLLDRCPAAPELIQSGLAAAIKEPDVQPSKPRQRSRPSQPLPHTPPTRKKA